MNEDISQRIHNLISQYDSSPYEINNGRCEGFMKKIVNQVPLSEECCTGFVLENDYMKYPIHVWIYYDNKHYDAEAPQGVDEFQKLPFFSNINIDSQDLKINKFTK